jgi:hypothetical protein
MATVQKDGKTRHQFSLSPAHAQRLAELREELAIPDNGSLVEVLMDNAQEVLAMKRDYDALVPGLAEREAKVAQAEADLTDRTKDAIRLIEELRQGTGLPQRAWIAMQELIEAGWRTEDITGALLLLGEIGLSPAPAAESIQSMGGALQYARKLAVEIQEMTDKRTVALADLQAATKALHEQLDAYNTVEQAVKQAGAVRDQAMAFASAVTRAYADCGLVLENIIDPIVTSEDHGQTMNLSERAKRVLAGTMLTMIVAEHGDHDLPLPAGAGRMVPSRVRISELPRLLAPSEAYRQQEKLIMDTRINAAVYRRLSAQGEADPGGDEN